MKTHNLQTFNIVNEDVGKSVGKLVPRDLAQTYIAGDFKQILTETLKLL